MTDSSILVNLAFALGMGLIGAILVARLGQSVILGYILAGVIIGPFTPGFVGDPTAVEALADIGIIFLMFAVGVQVSLRDLLRAGKIALLGGSAQVILIMALGYFVGVALGFPPLEALFFGAVISNSSSTVITKVLGDRGEVDSVHGRISLAWSSVQDLSTIIMVVVLPALAMGTADLGTDLLLALGKSLVFLVLLIPLGSRALPWFFERIAALKNREVFILTVAAIAMGTAYASTFFGLSLALGAFVAGVVVSESELSWQILGDITPIRDIFAALFFVSVGMLVNPVFVVENLWLVLVASLLLIVAKGALSAVITFVARYPIRTAVFTGVALAQSAEFSFLLARLGVTVGAVSSNVFSLMLAAATISIILSPNLFRYVADPLTKWLETRLAPSDLDTHPALATPEAKPRGHAIICGYGRVGSVIGVALRRRGFSFVVIDEDQRLVSQLRDKGITALLGNAANHVLLERANLARASILVIAISDALAARQLADYAKRLNSKLDIVVRVHNDTERAYMREIEVGEAVSGELELALEMTRRTLRRFGVSSLETQAIVQGLRERYGTPQDDNAPSDSLE